jgi:uncharacterized membrane protein
MSYLPAWYRRTRGYLASSGYPAAMLSSSNIIACAPTTDLRRARQFYQHVLGLRFVEQDDVACTLKANGTMLRITAVTAVVALAYTVLGWRVADPVR